MLPAPQGSARLDSWKGIADYLGRDVRTAMRWAKLQGLPVRRVAGGRGRSVFAFTAEIDGWLAGQTEVQPASDVHLAPADASAPFEDPDSPGDESPGSVEGPPRHGLARAWIAAALVLTGTAAVGALMIAGSSPRSPSAEPLVVSTSAAGVTVTMPGGPARSIYTFRPGTVLARETAASLVDLDRDGTPEILVGTGYQDDAADRTARSGELLAMDTDGTVRWRFGFDDALRFNSHLFGSPWCIMDWRVSPSATERRIAVAAHHMVWWPSVVVLLDGRGSRLGSYVNAGWIESVQWVDENTLAVAGFSNPKNGGMLAFLDARHLSGHSPGTGDHGFDCDGCPDGLPLRSFTFPRSELNLATASPFNRASVQMLPDRIIAMTHELAPVGGEVGVMYEFNLKLELVRATYSDSYWVAHQRLENQGLLHHTRAACPDRAGPRSVQMWDPAHGWRTIAPSNTR